jgi:protein-L-isoaspartate(D-aspartate) O-methyltransferase
MIRDMAKVNGADYVSLRRGMVADQVARRGVRDLRVLEALCTVPRHEFVAEEFRALAYADQPLPIGCGQTISQPYMVGVMTEALSLQGPPGHERVLEVGTGSGYQTAVLAALASEVWSIESHTSLLESARERLTHLGLTSIHLRAGDGTLGWTDAAPFDAILVTAAAPAVPSPLVEQLAEGGRLVIPVGEPEQQELLRITKHGLDLVKHAIVACRFVPLVGQFGWNK